MNQKLEEYALEKVEELKKTMTPFRAKRALRTNILHWMDFPEEEVDEVLNSMKFDWKLK